MNLDLSAAGIIEIVKNLSGDALPYIVTENEDKQLPENNDISFADFSESQSMNKHMGDIGVFKKKTPYDLIYSEDCCNFKKCTDVLNERGKIVIKCKKQNIRNVVQKAHRQNLFWCEKKEYKFFFIIIFRKVRSVKKPWNGETSGRLFIYSEHGWGDIFHKIRYLQEVSRIFRGEIILEARRGIERLFKNCFSEFPIIRKGHSPPSNSYAIELCHIDKIMGQEIGQKSHIPYIKINSSKTKNYKTKIGVAWQGHRLTFNTQRNTTPFLFKSLKKNKEVYCIQKFLDKSVIPNFVNICEINDWWDTANLINEMDFIVSVDTSVAHLAGAMGKDTRVILHKHSYYTPFNKTPSWYPTVQVYQNNTWEETIKLVSNDIKIFTKIF